MPTMRAPRPRQSKTPPLNPTPQLRNLLQHPRHPPMTPPPESPPSRSEIFPPMSSSQRAGQSTDKPQTSTRQPSEALSTTASNASSSNTLGPANPHFMPNTLTNRLNPASAPPWILAPVPI